MTTSNSQKRTGINTEAKKLAYATMVRNWWGSWCMMFVQTQAP